MDHYIDIRLRPDPDFAPAMLMGALYNKLHRALFDLQAEDVGISFPCYKHGVRARTLGNHFRLHGTQTRLQQLMSADWLTGMRDHAQASEVLAVPAGAQHINVARKQFNTGSPSRAKRYAKRHDISEEEAQQIYAKLAERRIELPFVQINSRSTQQRFSLFIEHGKPAASATEGTFSHYGLSPNATVPWF
ncbi:MULTISPECIES: type I-F CRISPR-associated endoribonuclease Cas6/Csy4 [unclassified Halomonas]|uniref:type I-F CRISPR-associated endoribonuclease Cas6/Csy4 n=1 Tax=unclassified Halomonas TaxID=2609666 RepID=UPI0007DA45DD|nr:MULTISPECIES: type I-F CRISPR-associated endoribonuclease Cas6/Csy4 [unclassified Halomonas]MBT2785775.1 type I-F CRISPR-associated endoribonuclease Cas6/Csy4 [Halomonas sp. ISL-106]MBT2798829.1 type I-F CRISPR-associated endoribonuclease Cas6/Csy4 [Halomonas sp. ISL-104]OAL59191.1 type I-F CRISPR-associated endoribonuclease Cas6/Csy4 [Halomonas sp. ALS9]